MLKKKAIELLGGSVSSAAEKLGVTYQAVSKWPDQLPPRISDRVIGALARQRLQSEKIWPELIPAEQVKP